MEILYRNPINLKCNNSVLNLVKICSNLISSPYEMIFVDERGREVKYADLDESNKRKANKIYNLYRLGRLIFTN